VKRLLAASAAALLALVACGSDGDPSSSPSAGSAPSTSTTPSSAATSAAPSATVEDPAGATATFPVAIEHKYGETVIEEEPERVVSVGYTDQDALLALGVIPVGIRDWYGEQPNAVWPWATDELGEATPTVLPAAEINFEAVAALQPDLIVGVSSGMTQEEYTALSAIAPTITQTADFIDYGLPWQEGTRMIGAAVGKPDEAEQLVAETEELFAAARAAHPEFEGATGVVGFALAEDQIGGYSEQDVRGRLLTDLGMVIPVDINERAGDRFYAEFSAEQVELLDHDALIWIASDETTMERIRASPLRQRTTAAAEGREIFLDDAELGGAASFSSVLSLPFVLEQLVPRLAAALDGDPATSTD
jgi:iron complex transport system substrate-binding protein